MATSTCGTYANTRAAHARAHRHRHTAHDTHAPAPTRAACGCTRLWPRWQGAKKKRLGSLRRYPTSVACLAFSPGGEQLAIAASYTWEQGEQPNTPPDAIYLHTVADSLVGARRRTAAARRRPEPRARTLLRAGLDSRARTQRIGEAQGVGAKGLRAEHGRLVIQ